ncbi:MAG: hypothetical protein CM15mV103_190 [uncultured marine virus]|nr:MAG: hypothetical protein CM15mV103_190 [uncultured marine virus]
MATAPHINSTYEIHQKTFGHLKTDDGEITNFKQIVLKSLDVIDEWKEKLLSGKLCRIKQ